MAQDKARRRQELANQVGNRGVNHLLSGKTPLPPNLISGGLFRMLQRQGLLTPAEETSAVGYTRARYDGRSIRIIQHAAGVAVDGSFTRDTAEAVAAFQDARPPLLVDGKVGPNTLNQMVPERVGLGRQEHAIQLVADFYNLDVTGDTLSVHFDSGLGAPVQTDFESGNLRVIRLGPAAFGTADDLRDAIQAGLAAPAPPTLVIGDRPTLLTPAQERAASRFNRRTYTDPRSVFAIQGLVGTDPDASFGPDTAERIAEYQDLNGLEPTGQVDEASLRVMVADFDLLGEQNSAIRLIMDFYNMSTHGGLLDIRFDPSVASNASTGGILPGPSIVRIGPAGFAQGYEGLVHTIAHELEHVRQRQAGIMSSNVREFLAEAIEIMSVDMPEENLAGFMSDARRALNRFNAMTADEQREHWERFEEVRDQVSDRFDAASAAEQATHQATMDGYDAVAEPAPAGP